MRPGKPEQTAQKSISIGELSRLTGASSATLRTWERRLGVPRPDRLPGGHRRYRLEDVELVRHLLAERAVGVPLATAVAHARDRAGRPATSIYAALRRRRAELRPQTLRQPMMLALSRAIEDESLSRAERPVIFGAFQRERFYRASAERWGELAAGAVFAAVFADFTAVAKPRGGPVEIPVGRDHPLSREWAVVCDAAGHGACLFGWEPPRTGAGGRRFEAIWSVEPDVVRDAARICAEIASVRTAIPEAVTAQLRSPAPVTTEDQLRLATAVTARALAYVEA